MAESTIQNHKVPESHPWVSKEIEEGNLTVNTDSLKDGSKVESRYEHLGPVLQKVADYLDQHSRKINASAESPRVLDVRKLINLGLYSEAHESLCDQLEQLQLESTESSIKSLKVLFDNLLEDEAISSLLLLTGSRMKSNGTPRSKTLPYSSKKKSDMTNLMKLYRADSSIANGPLSSRRIWKRPSESMSIDMANITKSMVISSKVSSPYSTLSRPLSPVDPKKFVFDGSGDQYHSRHSEDEIDDEKTLLSYKQTITFKLFQKAKKQRIDIDHDHHLSLAKKMIADGDYDDALEIINSLDTANWSMEAYKIAMFLHLHKVPKDYPMARDLLDKFRTNSIISDKSELNNNNDHSATIQRKSNVDEQNIMWLLYNSSSKDAKWTECIKRYEDAKEISTNQARPYLDNAMIEVAIVYEEFEYGWSVYEGMLKIDLHTCPLALNLCLKSFQKTMRPISSNEGEKSPDANTPPDNMNASKRKDELCKWEARAWAVFCRWQSLDEHSKQKSFDQISSTLLKIVKNSPEVSSRPGKIERISLTRKSSPK